MSARYLVLKSIFYISRQVRSSVTLLLNESVLTAERFISSVRIEFIRLQTKVTPTSPLWCRAKSPNRHRLAAKTFHKGMDCLNMRVNYLLLMDWNKKRYGTVTPHDSGGEAIYPVNLLQLFST